MSSLTLTMTGECKPVGHTAGELVRLFLPRPSQFLDFESGTAQELSQDDALPGGQQSPCASTQRQIEPLAFIGFNLAVEG